MRINRKKIVPFLGKYIPFFSWQKMIHKNNTPIFIPFYHALGDSEDLPHIQHLYSTRNRATFIEDIDFISKHFQAVSLEDLIAYSLGEKRFKKPVFHLCFDDGLRQVYEIALPILEQKGIPCSIFFNTDFIDNKNLFFRYEISLLIDILKNKKTKNNIDKIRSIKEAEDPFLMALKKELFFDSNTFLTSYEPYMTSAQIQDTLDRGFSIGGHGMGHPYFHLLNLEEQKREALGSVAYLKESFNINYQAFAFPFTDFGVSSMFFNDVFSREELDITFGTAGIQKSITKHFQRVPMEETNYDARSIIRGQYLYYWVKTFIKNN